MIRSESKHQAYTVRQRFDNKNIKFIAAFAAIYIIWGTTYLGIRIAIETIPPFLMVGTRFIIAGIVTFVFLRARGAPMPKRIHWRSAAIIGAFLIVGGNGLVTWSEQEIPSGIAALAVATMPIWMALFGWLIFKTDSINKRIIFGLILGIIGIGLLLGPGQILGTSTFKLTTLLVLMMAPILWSFGSLYSREAKLPDNIFMSTAMEMLIGGVLLMIAALLTGEVNHLNIGEISARSLLAMLYLTIFGSIVALTAYVWLLKSVHPARVVTYTYVNPVIAVFLGWLVFREPVTVLTLVAVVVITAAVILITTSRRNRSVHRTVNRPEDKTELASLSLNSPHESPAASD
jgi:drug/metabolite transporter (DMT)-like permease